ncbi:MAG: ArsS family sensor histidine kinase, partial [Campylobacterota bacterium]|nr:ArsS family sensor histidine kinase [Campylobacterota bacterium]
MKRESILFKLNILFALALIATLLAGFSFALHSLKKENMDLFFKSRLMVKEMRNTHQIPYALLNEFGFIQIKGAKKREVLKESRERKLRTMAMPKEMSQKFRALAKHRKVLHYKGHRYLHLKVKGMNIVVEDTRNIWSCCPTLIIIFLVMLLLLSGMYILLRKSLIPLKALQKNIEKYGEGAKIEHKHIDKNDEVSLASNAFYDSVKKVEQFKDSRQLFIRNIFHELNTPVTKGKILAEIVEEDKTKEMLNSIFTRLSILLKELAQMEKITSEDLTLVKKPIRIQELIDEASDLLYLDEVIKTNVSDKMIDVDFSLMHIVFKNLIDNALKYGEDLEIKVNENTINFMSKGERLTEELKYYIEAFSKSRNADESQGFGLGLYIVNEILIKHGMDFSY